MDGGSYGDIRRRVVTCISSWYTRVTCNTEQMEHVVELINELSEIVLNVSIEYRTPTWLIEILM